MALLNWRRSKISSTATHISNISGVNWARGSFKKKKGKSAYVNHSWINYSGIQNDTPSHVRMDPKWTSNFDPKEENTCQSHKKSRRRLSHQKGWPKISMYICAVFKLYLTFNEEATWSGFKISWFGSNADSPWCERQPSITWTLEVTSHFWTMSQTYFQVGGNNSNSQLNWSVYRFPFVHETRS